MSPIQKKSPGSKQASSQFDARHAQAKTSVSAQSLKRPIAPPLYRPQPVPKVLQKKSYSSANPHADRAQPHPLAPPVYRPQQAPKVLQTKSSLSQIGNNRAAQLRPVAPPVYRPEAEKIVQQQTISQLRLAPTTSPAYRSGQKRSAQPKMASAAPAPTLPKGAPVHRPHPNQVNAQSVRRPVVQRSAEKQEGSVKVYDVNMQGLKAGTFTYPGVSDVVITQGYESWKQDGVSYHVNWKLGDSRKGKEVFHVTAEGNPKHHYFFVLDPGIKDAVATSKSKSKTDHKFSDLPEKVQRFILTSMQYKFPHKNSMDTLMQFYEDLLAQGESKTTAWQLAWSGFQ
jgi:hypothetical protein